MDLEKTLLRKVGEAIQRFKMIRDGDRVAVALSGGKDSATLLEALLLLQKRAPIDFTVCAFTVEQGKFLQPYRAPWRISESSAALTGLISATRRRSNCWRSSRSMAATSAAATAAARSMKCVKELGANVIAFGHTADDFCEALLRNTMFTGKLSSLPAVTHSRDRDFRLIRPLVFVTEDITRAYAEMLGVPVVPCGCSQRTGTVRRSLRDLFSESGAGISAPQGEYALRHGQPRSEPPARHPLSTIWTCEPKTELFPIVTEL